MAYLGGPSGSCEDLVAQAVDKKKWDVCVPERAENISRTFAMCQVLADGLFFFFFNPLRHILFYHAGDRETEPWRSLDKSSFVMPLEQGWLL